MSKIKVVLNRDGVRDLMRSPEMQDIIENHAQAIAAKAGGNVDTYVAQTRAVAEVSGDDGNNSLLKAVGNHG